MDVLSVNRPSRSIDFYKEFRNLLDEATALHGACTYVKTWTAHHPWRAIQTAISNKSLKTTTWSNTSENQHITGENFSIWWPHLLRVRTSRVLWRHRFVRPLLSSYHFKLSQAASSLWNFRSKEREIHRCRNVFIDAHEIRGCHRIQVRD